MMKFIKNNDLKSGGESRGVDPIRYWHAKRQCKIKKRRKCKHVECLVLVLGVILF